jgi:hypothetical protein
VFGCQQFQVHVYDRAPRRRIPVEVNHAVFRLFHHVKKHFLLGQLLVFAVAVAEPLAPLRILLLQIADALLAELL